MEEIIIQTNMVNLKKGETVKMCCRACNGYEACQTKTQLRDDCCTQCRYFDSCMEMSSEDKSHPRTNPPKKKYTKNTKR